MNPEYHRKYELNRYRERRAIGIELLGGECVVCGAEEALEFDHVDPDTKAFDLGTSWSIALADWLLELTKCQLLCQPHHQEKTFDQNYVETHNRWRYMKHKCRCIPCKADYSTYRRARYLKNGT